MLKVLPSSVYNGTANAKCGEIYCHSANSFIILCTLCEMKCFDYGDFLLHFQNVHFENDLLKTEEADINCLPYLEVNLKNESESQSASDDDFDCTSAPVEEERLGQRLMKWEAKEGTTETKRENVRNEPRIDEACVSHEYNEDQHRSPSLPESKQKKESKDYKCEHCDKSYKNVSYLKIHINKAHASEAAGVPTITLQKCEDCALEFATIKRLDEHCQAEHGGIKCTHCEQRFNCKHNMVRHAERHKYGDKRTFACDFANCTKSFYTQRQLHAHKKSHTEPKNFVCDVCGYSCRLQMMLTLHLRTHTGEKPYECQQCGKHFRSTCLLKEHSAIHSTARPFVCTECGAAFGRQKALYHHKFLHSGVKQFKCKICGNAYAQLSGLAGHMRKHREDGIC